MAAEAHAPTYEAIPHTTECPTTRSWRVGWRLRCVRSPATPGSQRSRNGKQVRGALEFHTPAGQYSKPVLRRSARTGTVKFREWAVCNRSAMSPWELSCNTAQGR